MYQPTLPLHRVPWQWGLMKQGPGHTLSLTLYNTHTLHLMIQHNLYISICSLLSQNCQFCLIQFSGLDKPGSLSRFRFLICKWGVGTDGFIPLSLVHEWEFIFLKIHSHLKALTFEDPRRSKFTLYSLSHSFGFLHQNSFHLCFIGLKAMQCIYKPVTNGT